MFATILLMTRSESDSEYSKEKNHKKFFYKKFSLGIFFLVLLVSFKTYADPSLNEIRAKLDFSPIFFSRPEQNFLKRN